MKLRKGDTVIVISGGNSKRNNDKGKTGEVLSVDTKTNQVVVQGINVVVKHKKPTQQDTEGSIVTKEAPIDASNVAYYDTKTKERVKIGFKTINGKKVRVNKKTGLELGKKAPKAEKAAPKAEETKVEEVKPVEKAAAPKTTAAKTTAAKSTATKSTAAKSTAAKSTAAKKTTAAKAKEEAK